MIRRNCGAQHFDRHPVSKQDIRWIQQMKLFVCWDETIHVKIVERMLSIRLKDGWLIMPSPLIGGGIKRCYCLTYDVCLTGTSVCRIHRA